MKGLEGLKYLNRFERIVAYTSIAVAVLASMVLLFAVSMKLDASYQADLEAKKAIEAEESKELAKRVRDTQAKLEAIERAEKIDNAVDKVSELKTLNHLDNSYESKELIREYMVSHGYSENNTSIALSYFDWELPPEVDTTVHYNPVTRQYE